MPCDHPNTSRKSSVINSRTYDFPVPGPPCKHHMSGSVVWCLTGAALIVLFFFACAIATLAMCFFQLITQAAHYNLQHVQLTLLYFGLACLVFRVRTSASHPRTSAVVYPFVARRVAWPSRLGCGKPALSLRCEARARSRILSTR